MTNDEALMSKEIRSTNVEGWCLGIRHWFVIRHFTRGFCAS